MIQSSRAAGFADLPVERACALLGLDRSGYYRQPKSRIASDETALRDAIEDIVVQFAGYGYRRVTAQLARDGWQVNHKRVLRILREESLLCQLKRRWTRTTDSAHGLAVYPKLVKGLSVQRLNQVWVADITYIRLPSSFCYLAAVLDAFSRRCVGWHLSRSIDGDLAGAALEKALESRRPAPGLIHHSDRGVQYACGQYVERLSDAHALVSMAAKGTPRENAQAESFFGTLKMEEVYLQEYRTFDEAEASIRGFIEEVYNQKRLHSALGYLPPAEFEDIILAG
ncbi:MAG TPA: IS3 family transposase [Chloroflexota bacterium]|nr:IS3 family transposase [Chloroflexota bacterium]